MGFRAGRVLGPVLATSLCVSAALAGIAVGAEDAAERQRIQHFTFVAEKFFEQDRFRQAANLFRQAVEIAPRVYGRGKSGGMHLETARLKNYLANCYLESFNLKDAEALYRECLPVVVAEAGTRSQLAVDIHHNLAVVYRRLHQPLRAEKYFLEKLAIDSRPAGRAETALDLADLYSELNRFEEAEEHFRAARSYWADVTGETAEVNESHAWHGLGMIASRRENYAEARELLERALALRVRRLGDNHRYVAHSKGMLAIVHDRLGSPKRALQLMLAAKEAMRSFWKRDDHVEVALEQHELGLMLARRANVAQALDEFTDSRRAYNQYARREMIALAEPQQLQLLDEHRQRLQSLLSIAASRPGDERFTRQSLEWLLNEKGLAHETLGGRMLLERNAGDDPGARQLVQRLLQTRKRMAAIATRRDSPDGRRELQTLTEQERRLIRELGQSAAQTVPQPRSWVSLAAVREALSDRAVLVEVMRVDRTRPRFSALDPAKRDPSDDRYVAWTLTGADAQVRIFDLGPAAEIDAAVVEMRDEFPSAVSRGVRPIPSGRPRSSERAASRLRDLSKRILWPIAREHGEQREWIISPDGGLWLVPWAALPLADGRLLVEKATLRHVISGRDLLGRTPDTFQVGESLVLAAPDFDWQPPSDGSRGASSDPYAGLPRGGPHRDRFAGARRWSPLPGTLREATDIHPHVESFTGRPVRVLANERATELALRRFARPMVLVLATHGYFATDEEHLSNPQLRCGLALSGANTRSTRQTVNNDGILTGIEVLELDLRGTELVVLSACDTGVGTVSVGEGVAGLRQVFHLAGARSVVSTLWQIPDSETADLMELFWEGMNQSRDAAVALRQAQLAMIEKLETGQKSVHPRYWAAPVVTQRVAAFGKR